VKHLVAAIALFGLAGCGGSDHPTPEGTVRALYAAARAGDREAFVACFSERTQTLVLAGAKAREGHIEELMASLREKTERVRLKFRTTQLGADKAVVEMSSIGVHLVLVKEGGSWKIDRD